MFKAKKLLSFAIALILLLSLGTGTVQASSTTGTIKVLLDGKPLEFDVPPMTVNGRTMVPVRKIFESLGATVSWVGSTKTIIGSRRSHGIHTTVTFQQYNTQASVDREYRESIVFPTKNVTLDAAAIAVGGRTLVPVRFIAESMGAGVDWDNATKTVIITSPKDAPYSVGSKDDLYNAILSGLRNYKEFITLLYKNGSTGFDENTVAQTLVKVAADHPEVNYLQAYSAGSNYVELQYGFPLERVRQMRSAVDERVKSIVASVIKPGMTELQKEYALHDYVVRNTSYNYDGLLANRLIQEDYTAYGILVKGLGVCQGYSAAMNLLLQAAGIETVAVVGTASSESGTVSHSWNLVKIDGIYYHLDTTWDDPVYFEANGARKELLVHEYFNLTDEQLAKDHQWDRSGYPKADGTRQ